MEGDNAFEESNGSMPELEGRVAGVSVVSRPELSEALSESRGTDEKSSPAETGNGTSPVILIADDDAMVRMLAASSLGKSGFKVIAAENGRDALEAFQRYRPDLVLCDVIMPSIDGYDVCRLIRKEPQTGHIPILMLTGLEDNESINRAFAAGATDFATKPINWGLLAHRVRYALRASRAMRELKLSEQRYALAAEGANDGLWDWDIDNDQIYFSPRWKSMLGFKDGEIGTSPGEWFNRLHPDDKASVSAAVSAHTEGRRDMFETEYRIRTQTGEYQWMVARGLAVRDENGMGCRMVGSQTNITKRKEAEYQLRFEALHDGLTKLPNRALFLDRLNHSIQLAKRNASYLFAVIFIDLDRFKVINDSLGHLHGDRLLIEVALRIKSALRDGDTLARLGGDEFTILCEGITDINSVTRLIDRIMNVLGDPIDLQGQQVVTAASMGIAFSSSGYDNPEDILRDADAAMYRAKAVGGSSYVLFDEAMHRQAMEFLTLESELRVAVEKQQFRVYFQPILDLRNDQVSGFEALLRWNHPTRGVLLPEAFLSVAEESRLIVNLGRWVLKEACRQLVCWQQSWPQARGWFMSVNIGPVELAAPGLVEFIAETIESTTIDPTCLKLEITENSLIANGPAALKTMKKIKSLGVKLSIDDFGTGYSSFNYLHRFPFDALKIDASFISNFDQDAGRQEIVRTISYLAHNLGLSVVAEGSETEGDFRRLKKLSCEFAQGFSISRPGDAEQMEAFLVSKLTPSEASAS